MKVWLDDCRPAPSGWVWTKTPDEVQKLFQNGHIEEMSLDHDLGAYPCNESNCWSPYTNQCTAGCPCSCHQHFPTGYDLVKWMVATDSWPTKSIAVHSANPGGRQRMLGLIRDYAPKTVAVHE